jgi:hypothetical protein
MEILPQETINNPQALDAFFSEMHDAYRKELKPMTKDQTRVAISVMMSNAESMSYMYDEMKEAHWEPCAFFYRCDNVFTIKYEKRLLVWLIAMHADVGIGGLLLVAYYIQWRASKLKNESIVFNNEIERAGALTLSLVCERIFPVGIFTKETLRHFWDKQKVRARPDNLIDYPGAAESFIPTGITKPVEPYWGKFA